MDSIVLQDQTPIRPIWMCNCCLLWFHSFIHLSNEKRIKKHITGYNGTIMVRQSYFIGHFQHIWCNQFYKMKIPDAEPLWHRCPCKSLLHWTRYEINSFRHLEEFTAQQSRKKWVHSNITVNHREFCILSRRTIKSTNPLGVDYIHKRISLSKLHLQWTTG